MEYKQRVTSGPKATEISALKRQAATYAVTEFVRSGMVVGLGTGSTAHYALEAIAQRLHDGSLRNIVGIPTSRDTAAAARALGIPLGCLRDFPVVDVTIDGADEVDSHLDLIKGLGGALLWEKIVAAASREEVIIVDETKRVSRLGTRSPLPIEVVPFGWEIHMPFLETLGGIPQLRLNEVTGDPFITDGGHYIIDCTFPEGISDPAALAWALSARPGIVEHGLFLNMATAVVVGTVEGVKVLGRE